MRLDDLDPSKNYSERSGGRGGGGLPIRAGGLGLGGIIVVGLLMFFFPQTRPILMQFLGGGGPAPSETASSATPTSPEGRFIGQVQASTEQVWTQLFAEGKMAAYGYRGEYPAPPLVNFDGAVGTSCGGATSAVGPFYCPADGTVYIDDQFFAQLRSRFGAPGDFAQAYVIAHEVGHHIQNVIGLADRVAQIRAQGDERASNAAQVRLELQADCFAGVWGRIAGDQTTRDGQRRIEEGDLQEAMIAANAIGDDTLSKQAGRRPVPDSFTHGSSEQRQRWFRTGYESGDPASCDTFSAARL